MVTSVESGDGARAAAVLTESLHRVHEATHALGELSVPELKEAWHTTLAEVVTVHQLRRTESLTTMDPVYLTDRAAALRVTSGVIVRALLHAAPQAEPPIPTVLWQEALASDEHGPALRSSALLRAKFDHEGSGREIQIV